VTLLLDTQILLWAVNRPDRLSPAATKLLTNTANDLLFSAASLWEIAIKNTLQRDDFRIDTRVLRRALLDNDYRELPITCEHVASLEGLPGLHKDPFDRMLLAQATAEGITLLTGDTQLARYPGPVRKV
jgi:PIN domain nuclease of toxin-antitoxin system